MPESKRLRSLRLAAIASVAAGVTGAFAASGSFTFVIGEVNVVRANGQRVVAQRGTEVDPGDSILTGANGMAQLTMVDQARLSLRPGTQFRIDYIKASGAIGFYHPDWVVVQRTPQGEVNWIIETKGRVWEGTTAKDDAMKDWCKRISDATGSTWRYVRINQTEFAPTAGTLVELIGPVV